MDSVALASELERWQSCSNWWFRWEIGNHCIPQNNMSDSVVVDCFKFCIDLFTRNWGTNIDMEIWCMCPLHRFYFGQLFGSGHGKVVPRIGKLLKQKPKTKKKRIFRTWNLTRSQVVIHGWLIFKYKIFLWFHYLFVNQSSSYIMFAKWKANN